MNLYQFTASIVLCLVLTACSQSGHDTEELDKLVAEMGQRVIATTNGEKQGELIPRYNQPKTLACLHGEFSVAHGIPEQLSHGLFSTVASYPVVARFASASKWDDSERDIRGLSLKVSGIEGETLWGETGQQDFLFNSYPALFVATPEDFLGFMRARQTGSQFSLAKFFLSPFDPHIGALLNILKARKKHDSALDIRYWSTVPFALDNRLSQGQPITNEIQAVKYSMTPCSEYHTQSAVEPGENQLRAAIKNHLQQAPVCFTFGVQVQDDPIDMPLEDASVIWDEDASPFVTVATVTFNEQSMDDDASLDQCEKQSFNPWQSLPAHTPLGRMNAVRKAVYATGAYQRANQQ